MSVCVTFSRSWRSCLLLASLEHRLCSGATTVQIQRPSASCAELYTCQPSLGPMVYRDTHAYTHMQARMHIHTRMHKHTHTQTDSYSNKRRLSRLSKNSNVRRGHIPFWSLLQTNWTIWCDMMCLATAASSRTLTALADNNDSISG